MKIYLGYAKTYRDKAYLKPHCLRYCPTLWKVGHIPSMGWVRGWGWSDGEVVKQPLFTRCNGLPSPSWLWGLGRYGGGSSPPRRINILAARLNPLHSTPASRQGEHLGNFLSHLNGLQLAGTHQYASLTHFFVSCNDNEHRPSSSFVAACLLTQSFVQLRLHFLVRMVH